MRIDSVDLLRLRLRLKQPFEAGSVRLQDRDTVLLRAHSSEGLVGYGEAPALPFPSYTYETVDTVLVALQRYILPAVLGQDLPSVESLERHYQNVVGHPMAKCGLEAAYWHLRAQEEGKALWQLWGGLRRRVEVGVSFGVEPETRLLHRQVERALGDGYRRVKVKIEPGHDVSVVQALRNTFGAISLMVDANSAYSLDDAAHVQELDEFDLLMLEQPLGRDDLLDHARLQAQLRTPICLDESILSPTDARKAIDMSAARVINIKAPRLGGFRQAILAAQESGWRNIPVWCGGMLESGLGKVFNLHLNSLPQFALPGDTSGTGRYFEEDVLVQPLTVGNDSCIEVPQGTGLGVDIDEGVVKRLTISTTSVRASRQL